MKQFKKFVLVSMLVLCAGGFNEVFAMSAAWQKFNSEGEAAYKRGEVAQAELSFRAALNEAQKSDPSGKSFLFSLKRLAEVCKAQGKSSEADALLKSAAQLELAQKHLNSKKLNSESGNKNLGTTAENINKTQTQNSTNTNQKTSGQRTGGGWDLNDLRINRRIRY